MGPVSLEHIKHVEASIEHLCGFPVEDGSDAEDGIGRELMLVGPWAEELVDWNLVLGVVLLLLSRDLEGAALHGHTLTDSWFSSFVEVLEVPDDPDDVEHDHGDKDQHGQHESNSAKVVKRQAELGKYSQEKHD